MAIFALIIIMVGGISVMRNSNNITMSTFYRHYNYIKYKIALDDRINRLTASVNFPVVNSSIADVPAGNTVTTTAAGDRTSGFEPAIPVLLYHGITDEEGKYNMTAETFWNQMLALKKAGYETLTIREFEDIMNGKARPSGKRFLLTFDDGRMDSYVGADPVIRALGYTAVMYISSQNSLKKNGPHSYYIGLSELGDMLKSGRWEIGSHAAQVGGDSVPVDALGNRLEFLSNKKWLTEEESPAKGRLETDEEYIERVKAEIGGSKKEIEDALGIEVPSFAYPSSDYGQRAKNNPAAIYVIGENIRKEYRMAFEQVWPEDDVFTLNYPGIDMSHLRRIETPKDWSGDTLLAYIRSAEAKQFPYTEEFTEKSGWKSSWGKVYADDSSLNIEAGTSTAGAQAFLDGSYPWKDYMYSVSVDWQKGGYVTLYSRYQNPENHFSCIFGGGRVRINKRIGGEDFLLSDHKEPVDLLRPVVSLGMAVQGDRITCYEGSLAVSTAEDLGFKPDRGGIALQVWDENISNAVIAVKSLKAVPISEMIALLDVLPKYALLPTPKPTPKPRTARPANPRNDVRTAVKVFDIPLKDKSGKNISYVVNGSNLKTGTDSASVPGTWVSGSNKISIQNGTATLGTVPPFVAATSILFGGSKWEDYEYLADIVLGISSKVAAVGRYADSSNYLSCEYLDRTSWVMLIQVRDGQRRFLGGGQDDDALAYTVSNPERKIGMRVKGNQISCLGAEGREIVRAEIPDAPARGTVGLKVYAETPGIAAVHLRKAEVNPL